MQLVIEAIEALYRNWSKKKSERIELLPQAGSDRRYFRIHTGGQPVIATHGNNVPENEAFIYFSEHFRNRALPVPEIFAVSDDKTIYLQELKTLEEKFINRFHIQFLFSNIVQLSRARLHRGLLITFLNEFSSAAYAETLFYICGPEPYMRLCTYTLQENDVPKNNIKREDFVINAVRKRDALPPDKRTHFVKINFNDHHFQFEVHYPDSILQAAKKAGISLPYSCEAGRCASCVAKCLSGQVWHSYNEVLTEKDLQQHSILTCVGHAVNGDVELAIQM